MKRLFLSSLGVQILVRLINLWTGILGARFLGPSGRGALVAANRWSNLFIFLFALGVPAAVTFLGKKNEDKRNEYIGTYLILGMCIGFVGWGVGAFMVPHLLLRQPRYLIHLAEISMVTVPFGILADGLVGTLLTLNRFKEVLGLRLIGEAGVLVVILTLIAFHHYTVTSFIVGSVTWSVVGFLLTLFLLLRKIKPRFNGIVANSLMLLRKGVAMQPAFLVGMLGANLDQLVISLFLSPYTLGLYAVASTIGGVLPAIVNGALNAYLWPKLMDFGLDERKHRVERIHSLLFYSTLAFSVIAGLVLPVAIPLVYGRLFTSALFMSEVMLVGSAVNIGYIVVTNFLLASNEFNVITKAEIVGLVAGLMVTIPLIHIWEGTGAAIGVLVANLSKWVYVVVVSRRVDLSFAHLMRPSWSAFLSLGQRVVRGWLGFPRVLLEKRVK